MVSGLFRIPRLARTADGDVQVTHWGQAAATLFRVGDSLIVDPARQDGLVVLIPRGWGNPMLGRRDQGGLVAEPGNVPASPQRWSVSGTLTEIERDLERGGVGTGRWWVSVRIESEDLTSIAEARSTFAGGWLDAEELDLFCRRAAVAPEQFGVSIALAAADTVDGAEEIVAKVPGGRIRYRVRPVVQNTSESGQVLAGPWRAMQAEAAKAEWTYVEEAGRPMRVAGRRSDERVQLSLFGDTACLNG